MKEPCLECVDNPPVGAQFPARMIISAYAYNQKSYDSRKNYIRLDDILLMIAMLTPFNSMTSRITNRVGASPQGTVVGRWFQGSTSKAPDCILLQGDLGIIP